MAGRHQQRAGAGAQRGHHAADGEDLGERHRGRPVAPVDERHEDRRDGDQAEQEGEEHGRVHPDDARAHAPDLGEVAAAREDGERDAQQDAADLRLVLGAQLEAAQVEADLGRREARREDHVVDVAHDRVENRGEGRGRAEGRDLADLGPAPARPGRARVRSGQPCAHGGRRQQPGDQRLAFDARGRQQHRDERRRQAHRHLDDGQPAEVQLALQLGQRHRGQRAQERDGRGEQQQVGVALAEHGGRDEQRERGGQDAAGQPRGHAEEDRRPVVVRARRAGVRRGRSRRPGPRGPARPPRRTARRPSRRIRQG